MPDGKTTRRSQAERRLSTQAAIMASSIQILIEDGYARFSASRVAAEAGVSRGAQEHYFPKKIDLMEAVTRHVMDEALRSARANALQAKPDGDAIAKFLSDSEHFFFTPPFRAITEIMIAARAEPDLAARVYPIVLSTREQLDAIWAETLEGAGYGRSKAEHFVELTHFLMRGLFFVENWLPFPLDRSRALSSWSSIAPLALASSADDAGPDEGKPRTRRPAQRKSKDPSF